MAKDDYFKIVYVILKELYEHKKQGRLIDEYAISYKRLEINKSYWLDILEDLKEDGYIKGITIRSTKTGRYILNMGPTSITMKGIEYLKDNSMMKQVYNTLKELKDFI